MYYYMLVHHHRFGESVYQFTSNKKIKKTDNEYIKKIISYLEIDFEENREDEYIELDVCSNPYNIKHIEL